MTQSHSERCSERQLEHFLKQQYLSSSDSGGGYRLIVKENLKLHSAATKDGYFIDKDHMVQYQGTYIYHKCDCNVWNSHSKLSSYAHSSVTTPTLQWQNKNTDDNFHSASVGVTRMNVLAMTKFITQPMQEPQYTCCVE